MCCFTARLASGQGRAKAGEQINQAGTYLASSLPAHVAPGEEQEIGPAGHIAPVSENLSRDSPDAAAGHRASCGPPQREDQLPVGPWRAVPAEGPWASAHAYAVAPKADRRRLAARFPHRGAYTLRRCRPFARRRLRTFRPFAVLIRFRKP
jgi:hypothetical protein